MNTDWDRRFLELASVVGSWSKDPSTKVGAVIVNENKQIVSMIIVLKTEKPSMI